MRPQGPSAHPDPDFDADAPPPPEGGQPADRPAGWLGSLALVAVPFVVFALLLTLDRLLR
jgi:hypothetical protein